MRRRSTISRRASDAAPPVLIVGLSTRALAESAVHAGYECATIDAFGDLDQKARVQNLALGRRFSPGAAAAAAAATFPGRAVVYGSSFENHPASVARLSRGRTLLGNTPRTLRTARDVARLQAVVAASGGRVPRTLDPSAPRAADRRWLRKPRRGGGGTGVRVLEPGADAGPRELVQEFVEGTPASVAFAADGRRAVVLGLARGLAGETAFGTSGFRYCGSLYPFRAPAALRQRLEILAQAVTEAFALVGVNGLDFVARADEPFVLELNPRYCASMELVERATGLSVFDAHVDACRGRLPAPPETPLAGVWGKAILWADADAVAPDTRAWLSRDDVRDVPAPGERLRRGQPVCTVFAAGADEPRCHARLVATAQALWRECRVGVPA